MSTSDRNVLIEAAACAALVIAAVAFASPGDVWLRGYGLHPMWLPVIVLSARYAHRGLFPALALTVGGLLLTGLAMGESIEGFSVRSQNASDLLALATAVLVAWIAMLHEGRIERAVRRLSDATEAQKQSDEHVRALHASLGYLRSRHDRLDVSISLWRSLASRLERGDATGAARAVLELCEIRTGCSGALVQVRDGNKLTTIASRGGWVAAVPHELSADATIRAAVASRKVTPASPGATEADCDVAVPVTDEDGAFVMGVIALRGIPTSCLRAAELRDLAIIAGWLAPALARQSMTITQRLKTSEVMS